MIWKEGEPWDKRVQQVLAYYEHRPDLKYGPYGEDKAFDFLDDLCKDPSLQQSVAKATHHLTMDGVMTILSNVTKAIQGTGKVWAPDLGGWYIATDDPYTYHVAPGFAEAWKAARATHS